MTDAAHHYLGKRLDQCRNTYRRAIDRGDIEHANLALIRLDALLDEYIARGKTGHKPVVPAQRESPTDVPVPPTPN